MRFSSIRLIDCSILELEAFGAQKQRYLRGTAAARELFQFKQKESELECI